MTEAQEIQLLELLERIAVALESPPRQKLTMPQLAADPPGRRGRPGRRMPSSIASAVEAIAQDKIADLAVEMHRLSDGKHLEREKWAAIEDLYRPEPASDVGT